MPWKFIDMYNYSGMKNLFGEPGRKISPLRGSYFPASRRENNEPILAYGYGGSFFSGKPKKPPAKAEGFFGDPIGNWFEPLLAHFEQLRLIYETMEQEDNDE